MSVPDADLFYSPVDDTRGTWPMPPGLWSYSSLHTVEQCPRRWAMSNATYPTLWGKHGYPDWVDVAPIVGTVVHRSVERVVRAFHDAQCFSTADPKAVAVLKELGGYSEIVMKTVATELAKLDDNPRMVIRKPRLEVAVRLRIPELRSRVQVLVSRITLEPNSGPVKLDASAASTASAAAPQVNRKALVFGSHPEVSLEVEDLRFRGIADLITLSGAGCSITDYKTGSPQDGHVEQIRDYALLWTRDRERNPASLPVTELTISYVSHAEKVRPPTEGELVAIADDLRARVAVADSAVRERPPRATPDPEVCSFCSVRHLCEPYWSSLVARTDLDGSAFVDVELVIEQERAPRSWTAAWAPSGRAVVFRAPDESFEFKRGEHVRLLRASTHIDEETTMPVITMGRGSELYRLTS